ncbi:MAG: diguanylate cyclase [Sporomusaceae bacterium]|nr:diguanylate cyclase [Sporomusaceae bacterium]
MQSSSVRSLSIKYIVALSLIALLALAAYFTLRELIIGEQVSAAVINVSGRQRMLSQKAVLLSQQLVITPGPAERNRLRAELRQVIATISDAHYALVYGDPELRLPGGLSPAMGALVFNPPVMLDAKLQQHFAALGALLALEDNQLTYDNPQLAAIMASVDGLLAAQDAMVAQFQRESEERVARLQALERLVLGLTLLVLLMEAMFIFRPAVQAIAREQEQLAAANVELQRLSNQDGLTGIANRRVFDDFLDRVWRQAMRDREPVSLLMADIDKFKLFNDTYGHQAGDDCLRQVAWAIADVAGRAGDLAARYGGEEFAVVLAGTDSMGAAVVAEKIRVAVASLNIAHDAGVDKVVTISLGLATMSPRDGERTESLIAAADQALYGAKQQGRNRVVAVPDNSESGG